MTLTRITKELEAECLFVALARCHGTGTLCMETVDTMRYKKAMASKSQCPKWPLFNLSKAQRNMSIESVGKLIKRIGCLHIRATKGGALSRPPSQNDDQIVIEPPCIWKGDHQLAGLIVILKVNLLGVQHTFAGSPAAEHQEPASSMRLHLQALQWHEFQGSGLEEESCLHGSLRSPLNTFVWADNLGRRRIIT